MFRFIRLICTFTAMIFLLLYGSCQMDWQNVRGFKMNLAIHLALPERPWFDVDPLIHAAMSPSIAEAVNQRSLTPVSGYDQHPANGSGIKIASWLGNMKIWPDSWAISGLNLNSPTQSDVNPLFGRRYAGLDSPPVRSADIQTAPPKQPGLKQANRQERFEYKGLLLSGAWPLDYWGHLAGQWVSVLRSLLYPSG